MSRISSVTKAPLALLFMFTVIGSGCQRNCRSVLAFHATATTSSSRATILSNVISATGIKISPALFSSMTTSSSDSSPSTSNQDNGEDLRFGPFKIASNQIFYKSSRSAAFVNLRPIVPGHVLVMPRRTNDNNNNNNNNNSKDSNLPVLLSDLDDDEYQDLWQSVRVVQRVLKQHYKCDAFNVAVQDGEAAGQSVPHVHVHVLPRSSGDYERNDDIYQDIEDWAPRGQQETKKKQTQELQVLDDEDRKDRTTEQMAQEAAIYRSILESE